MRASLGWVLVVLACTALACSGSEGSQGVAAGTDTNTEVGTDTAVGGTDTGGGSSSGCSKDADCAGLEDGNACNGTLRCDVASGACKLDPSTVVSCDPKGDTACTRAACDPAGGACSQQPVPDGYWCDDGDPCTAGDHCSGGTCAAGNIAVCPCTSDADCPDPDDDVCTGVQRCDTSKAPYLCRPKAGSAIVCEQDDDACTLAACNPKTGACSQQPVADGGTCDDGNPCTKGDQCLKGVCSGGSDTCKCNVDADCEDDGNLCNGTPYCDKTDNGGTCKVNPKTVVSCNDQADTACLKNSCVAALGTCKLSAVNEGVACDDGDTCSTGEICVGGACTAGTDTCKCSTDQDCAAKEDGNLCNGTLFCNKAKGLCELNPATIKSCPTVGDTACAKNVCVPETGKCEVQSREKVKQLGCQTVDLGGGIVAQFCVFAPIAAGESADPGPFACEDGQSCTKGDVCADGACKSGAKVCDCASDADCADKDDGNLCNGTMFCDPAVGKCAVNPATIVTCPSVDDTVCLKNLCQPKTGSCQATASATGTACDDGNACTKGDACKLGTCASGPNSCECQSDADCAAKEDGNLCNGTLFCDKSGPSPVCKVDPKSIVSCPNVDDTACLKNLCQPKTGSCQPTQVAPGTSCDDGEACTKGDVCKLGSCVPGPFTCECKTNADCASKEDGNLCNGTLYCDTTGPAPLCKLDPKTVVSCPNVDDTACSKNTCNVKTGLCGFVDKPSGTACDDGDLCTAGDACQQGKCAPGTFTCACKTDADCASKEDGNYCNGTLYCDNTGKSPVCKVAANTIITCPSVDDTACVKNTCQPKSGACAPTQVAPGTNCDDGDACTKNDVCKLGVCTGGSFACECKADADCLGKDDGNLCNGVFYCDKSGAAPLCKPLANSAIFCSKVDDSDCLKAACDAKTGKCALQPVTAGTACDDGKVCTVAEVCSSGACGSGKPNACDDGNPCTVDSCDATLGCKHTAKSCDDGNACTAEGCDGKTGNCTAPVAVKAGTLCNADNSGCTAGDACNGSGTCTVGTPVVCAPPSNPCEAALCVDKGGSDYSCATAKRADGSACDDGKSCLVGATCTAGACQPPTLDTLFATPGAANLPAIGTKAGYTSLRGVAALPKGDIAVAGQSRAKVGDPTTTNKAFVSRYDQSMQAGRLRWNVSFGGPVASASTTAVAVAAVGEDVVVASDLPLANGTISADLRRLDSAGKTVWTVTPSTLAWVHAANSAPGSSGRVQALDVEAGGAIALVVSPLALKGSVIGGVTQGSTHDTIRLLSLASDGSKVAEWLHVPQEVWGHKTVAHAQVRWTTSTSFAVTALETSVDPANKTTWEATAMEIGSGGATISDGAFESDHGYHDDQNVPNPGPWVGQVLLRDGSGRIVRGRLRHNVSKGKVDGLFERTDAKGVNPLRYDVTLSGEPRSFAPLGKGALAFAGAISNNAGVLYGAMDSRGNLAWSKTIATTGWIFRDLAVGAGDHVLVAVDEVAGGTTVGRVLRVDAFGHDSCGGAGVCVGKTSDSCDDTDTCTRDGCDAKTGCTHTATDGLACDASNGCSARAVCGTGVCKQGDMGRMFTTIGGVKTAALSQPYVDDKLGVCWISYQSAGNTLPPTRYCLPWDQGPVTLDINTAPSAACDGMAALDQNLLEGIEAVPPAAAGGVPGCVRWGDAFASGSSGHRAMFSLATPSWKFNYSNCATSGCDEHALAMHLTPSGAVWGVQYDTPKASGVLRARRIIKGILGTATANATTTFARTTVGNYRASAARLDDGLLIASALSVSSVQQAKLLSLNANGSTAYLVTSASTGRNMVAYAVVPLKDGGAIVVGESTPSGGLISSWRWRVNKFGQTLWSKLPSSPDGRALVAALPLASEIVAVGAETNLTTTSGLLTAVRYDSGNTLWEQTLGKGLGGIDNDWARLVDLPDGGFAVYWRLSDGQYDRAAITRTDAWGHATCTAAALCSASSLVDCDDGNTCTVDGCDDKTGKCTHLNGASTAPCGTSGACNASAVCVE